MTPGSENATTDCRSRSQGSEQVRFEDDEEVICGHCLQWFGRKWCHDTDTPLCRICQVIYDEKVHYATRTDGIDVSPEEEAPDYSAEDPSSMMCNFSALLTTTPQL